MRRATLIHADCVVAMKRLRAESVDAIVCDPPYGLEFMHRDFDVLGDGAAQQAWHSRWAAEALRVLKPGGWMLAFGGSRTYHRLACALEDAGFELHDSLHWVYGSGMNKVGYLSYMLERKLCHKVDGQAVYKSDGVPMQMAPPFRHPDADSLWGWGGALRPAVEPIVRVRKPFSGTLVATVLRHGTGGLNINGCRVATGEEISTHSHREHGAAAGDPDYGTFAAQETVQSEGQKLGRWPANLLLTHVEGCRIVGTTVVKGDSRAGQAKGARPGGFGDVGSDKGDSRPAGTLHGDEAVQQWECAPGCPVAALDAQAGGGHGASAPASSPLGVGRADYGILNPRAAGFRIEGGSAFHNDGKGSVSRFFPTFTWEDEDFLPLMYQAKAARSEREAGCDALAVKEGRKIGNNHATVKPVALMRWLVRLVTPPGGLVLDPFAGSGTTLIAAVRESAENVKQGKKPIYVIGIEKDKSYIQIAQARVAHALRSRS